MAQIQQEIPKQDLPLKFQGRWVRFREKIDYRKANCNVIVGIKETGKSALNENLATHYKEASKNAKIFDLFGSRDNEGLAWCRSPYDKVLFILADSVDVSCSYDTIHLQDLRLDSFRNYDVILSVSAFYNDLKTEHLGIKALMDLLWQRTYWHDVWYLLIRETANLIYSRISVGEDQTKAKAYLIYVLREARHMGYAVGADAIRYMSVDIDLRALADFTFIKACGQQGLPRSLKWVYKYYRPYSIMRMPVDRFIMITKKGTLGRGSFEYPLWHKTEKENMLKVFDIQPEYGDPIDYGKRSGVSDFEHERAMRLRSQKVTFEKILSIVGYTQTTIRTHVKKHNRSVDRQGFCPICKRVKSNLANQKI